MHMLYQLCTERMLEEGDAGVSSKVYDDFLIAVVSYKSPVMGFSPSLID